MITSITVICSIIFGLRKRCYWLLGLSIIYYLLAISFGLVLRPIMGYANTIAYIALFLLIVYLAYGLLIACKRQVNGRVAKTPLVLVGVAGVLRIASFICSKYLHAHVVEWYFNQYDKIETFTNVIHILMALTLCMCYCMLLYFVFSAKRKFTGQGAVVPADEAPQS